jgi:hypothetical protein
MPIGMRSSASDFFLAFGGGFGQSFDGAPAAGAFASVAAAAGAAGAAEGDGAEAGGRASGLPVGAGAGACAAAGGELENQMNAPTASSSTRTSASVLPRALRNDTGHGR